MNTRLLSLTLPLVVAVMLSAPLGASATCVAPDVHAQSSAAHTAARTAVAAAPAIAASDADDDDASIVGLWSTVFYAGDGPGIWDQAFEQWHSDGTELALDNGVPPAMGNVCLGIWKQNGKAITLYHVAWNWDYDGHLAGTFELRMTVTLDSRGRTFSGQYVSDSYDLQGNAIPDLHAEGVVRGKRISVK